jgi:hypothetical protein
MNALYADPDAKDRKGDTMRRGRGHTHMRP